MKRFIDLRHMLTGARFAWWDTCVDRFETFDGTQAWRTFDEFAADAASTADIERYRRLAPAWCFEPATEAECFGDEPEPEAA